MKNIIMIIEIEKIILFYSKGENNEKSYCDFEDWLKYANFK